MSGGAGSTGAGNGPAGYNPVAAPSPTSVGTPPRAVNYDPVTRDWTTTEGFYDSIHPIDQAVILALCVEKGSLKSAPNVGQDYRKAQRVSGPAFDSQIRDLTRQALKVLIDAKSIQLISVQVDSRTRGQTKVAVTYVNLKTQRVVVASTSSLLNAA